MPQPIERLGYVISNGVVNFRDVPVQWDRIDALAGRRMDRRKSWAIVMGKLCGKVSYRAVCSGCANDLYQARGFGCTECGYHGVVINSMWVPEQHIRDNI